MSSFIEVRDVHKSFGSLKVLKGVNLSINQGEMVAIVGASGTGKTTLLQILGVLDSADSGSIRIAGCEPMTMSANQQADFRNQHIGFVFQFHELLSEFSAAENVALPAMIGGVDRHEAMAKAKELLELVGLSDRANHRPAELSGGEKQRVAVARALINKPDVILADEPSGSLDVATKEEIHQLFFRLCRELGQTFVIVTHDQELAARTDRQFEMVDGVVRD